MILVVALNPALDVTHEVAGVDWSGVNRPSQVRTRPGGKGLNVARILHALGADVHVVGFAGGITGAGVASALAAFGVTATFTPISAETRRTFAVVDARRGGTALFNEPGPPVQPDDYAAFHDAYQGGLAGSAAVVLTGSLPAGLSPGSYAELSAVAAAAGVPAVLDAHGDALLRAAAAQPAIVKPNLAELEAVAGLRLSAGSGPDWQAVRQAAVALREAGPEAVVVTLGEHGVWAATSDGCWQATPPRAVAGNPTGAGDAVAAGLAHGLALGRPWDERLRHAVALGAAAAAAPVAGEFSVDDYRAFLPAITVCRDGTLP